MENKSGWFRTEIGQNIFNQKYSHDGTMDWPTLAWTLVNDVCGYSDRDGRSLMNHDDMYELFTVIRDMKFIPGGRYLYYAGRKMKAYNNCFTGDTRLFTSSGLRRMDSVQDGEEVHVLSPVEGTYLKATMHSHGVQPVQEITFAPLRGKSKRTWKVRATRTHRWPLVNGNDTYDIRLGDVVPAGGAHLPFDVDAFLHGMIFADASSYGQLQDGRYSFHLRLCGDKEQYKWAVTTSSLQYTERQTHDNGDPSFGVWSPRDLKAIPYDESPAYIASFLQGWLALDGTKGTTKQIHCVDENAIDFLIECCPLIGMVASGDKHVETRPSNFGPRKPLFYVNLRDVTDWEGFKVVSIKPCGMEKVWCPFEPTHNRIVLEHGINTFQCYLLKGEEDTREEWGNLLKRASDCLMTGGGIGIDYSVFRHEGAKLGRTGGLASGPIPLMHSVNEVGRNVMQGGSRRSAIYASLLWNHLDAPRFLTMKDWHNMPIGKQKTEEGDAYTLWHAKQEDFNYPCPLDMTNVSLNYDDDWLALDSRHLHPTFLKNCEQAMRTGEPGFAFNFGDKRYETLRNACTEVTSEDDSDVCNLGSVNMSRIDSVREFERVVELATMFLVCGTLRADLPSDKIRMVREKNRRLGLGLMGIHEWLLKKGSPYEVTPELHKWLAVYRDKSNAVANSFCDFLGISRPVANRAIAPTGTIGMLAGTTTGIEPLFAVAYKRRYLKGKKWHYQYMIDGTADLLIHEYGLDPQSIDTAYGMANDFEKRIKFQADIQDYVDMAISSTINIPSWGSENNNESKVGDFALVLSKYAPRLRGFTVYPDGSRGGQPITMVDYQDAVTHKGVVYEENDACLGGVCGI